MAEFGTVIARRSYFSSSDQSAKPTVEVEIGTPVSSLANEGEFSCSFRIRSADAELTETVYGADALQALQLVLGYLKLKLQMLGRDSGKPLRWMEGEASDLGINIPDFTVNDR